MKLVHLVSLLALVTVACAKEERSLPGGSVDSSGRVTLSPPAPTVGPQSTATAKAAEPLGAIERTLFTPELVMENQAAIALTDTQRDAILKQLDVDQKDLLHLQWELQGEKEKLVKVLDVDVVDEKAADAAAAAVMAKENAVKAAHLRMLVRLKNQLTPAQQAKLRALREPAPR